MHAKAYIEYVDNRTCKEYVAMRRPSVTIEMVSSINDSIDKVIRPLRTWRIQKTFSEHLAHTSDEEDNLKKFEVKGGVKVVARCIEDAPQAFDQD